MYMSDATINNEGYILEKITGFEWDVGNQKKSLVKHEVTSEECEEVFFDYNKVVQRDVLHSISEKRYILIGQTKKERMLYIAFTTRKDRVRVISARDINKKERKLYEEKT